MDNFTVYTYTGVPVWTGRAHNQDEAMRRFRQVSGIGYPNGALYDGNYLVRRGGVS